MHSFDFVFFEHPSKQVDALNLARNLFDLWEYWKAAFVLKKYADEKNQSALFLYNLANFMVSEQVTEEERFQCGDNASRSQIVNKEMIYLIEQDLDRLYKHEDSLSAANLYLYGVILKQRDKIDKAKEVLVKAINKFPLLWSAWQELCLLIKKTDKQIFRQIKNHWIKNFYFSSFFINIQQEDDSCFVNSKLIETFWNSLYLINEIANACYLN